MICYNVYLLSCLLLLFAQENPAKSLNILNIEFKFAYSYFELDGMKFYTEEDEDSQSVLFCYYGIVSISWNNM